MVKKKEKFVFKKIGKNWTFGRNNINKEDYQLAHIIFWISSFLFLTGLLASLHMDINVWASDVNTLFYGVLIALQTMFSGMLCLVSFCFVLLGIPKCEKLYEKVNVK